MMADISFIHLATAGKKTSTSVIVKQIRSLYPDAYYFLASDCADDLESIAKDNNTDYKYYSEKLGYPGYDSKKLVSWLNRFRTACLNAKTSHIMMVEDDVWVKKPLTIQDDWEMACHLQGHGNIMHPILMGKVEEYSGKKPNTNQYGGGGGSIFKVSTFLDNFDRIVDWFDENTNYFKMIYPPIGFMDCYMPVYYMLCGKDYTINPYLVDTHHHKQDFDFDGFVNSQPEEIEIVNNYKKYYWI
jgi:hypothetical protein